MRRADVLWIALAALLGQAWILDLPFQLDDFLLLADPWSLFGHVETYRELDIPPFMCRLPMWLAWGLVQPFAGDPLSPVPFHLFGLLLHLLTGLLVARAVGRVAPEATRRTSARLAGLAFVLAGGSIQAVSWTSAWSDLFLTLFAVLGLNLALDARAAEGRRRALAYAGAVLSLALAVVSKAPAPVAVAAVGVLLVGGSAGARIWRRAGLEASLVALGLLVGWVTRALYLGSFQIRYEERSAPGLTELPAALSDGLVTFGQALYPWNRDPLFTGDEPLLAALGLGAGALAAAVCLPLWGLALLAVPRARGALALLALALVPTVLPSGLLYADLGTNVLSRTTYLPMAVAAAALGLACGGLFTLWRTLGLASAAVLFVFLIDGNRHVARTERLRAEDHRAALDLLDDLAGEAAEERAGRDTLVLALVPDGGFGGIPSLGTMLSAAHAPPFAPASPLEIEVFGSPSELRTWLTDRDLSGRDVFVLGPECDADWLPLGPDPALEGSPNRSRRRLRRLSPLRPAASPSRLLPVEDGWTVDPPQSAHAAGALTLTLRSVEAPSTATLVFDTAGRWTVPVPLDASEPATRTVELPTDPAFRFGPPLSHITWQGPTPTPSALLEPTLPPLTPLSPAPDQAFDTTELATSGPTFEVQLPPPAALVPGTFARLELAFELKGNQATVYSDFDPTPNADGLLAHRPTLLHLSGDHPTPMDPAACAPWSTLITDRLTPRLSTSLTRASYTWRITLHHPTGTPTARSLPTPGRITLPPQAP